MFALSKLIFQEIRPSLFLDTAALKHGKSSVRRFWKSRKKMSNSESVFVVEL